MSGIKNKTPNYKLEVLFHRPKGTLGRFVVGQITTQIAYQSGGEPVVRHEDGRMEMSRIDCQPAMVWRTPTSLSTVLAELPETMMSHAPTSRGFSSLST